MPGVLLCCLACQADRGAPLAGVLHCRWVLKHCKGHWVGSYSVVPCIRCLMGQPLYLSAADAGMWGEAMVMASPTMGDSEVLSCFHGCLAFLYRHFPPQSPPSYPLRLPLHRQQQPSPWNCSTIPKFWLPADMQFREPMSLSGVSIAAARTV